MTRRRAAGFTVGGEAYLVISAPVGELPPSITDAERDVARAFAGGASRRDIAERRGTSISTVSNQLTSLYRKLKISSRSELVAYVSRRRR